MVLSVDRLRAPGQRQGVARVLTEVAASVLRPLVVVLPFVPFL